MNNIQLTNEQLGKIAAGLLFSGLFIYLYAFYFWMPVSKTIESNTQASSAMERDIASAKAQKAAYPDLEAKLTRLKKDKEDVKQMLPGEKKFPDLIRTLTALSAKYKVSIRNISPGGSTNTEYFIKTPYQISATGDYHAIGRFLTAIGLEVRIMTVENLVLNATPDSASGTASATFTLIAYQYNEAGNPGRK